MIECKCDGCRRKIKSRDPRETFSAIHDETGRPFVKTLCLACVKEIVAKFKDHLKAKEAKAKEGTDDLPLQV